jgi:hypothetical protein
MSVSRIIKWTARYCMFIWQPASIFGHNNHNEMPLWVAISICVVSLLLFSLCILAAVVVIQSII